MNLVRCARLCQVPSSSVLIITLPVVLFLVETPQNLYIVSATRRSPNTTLAPTQTTQYETDLELVPEDSPKTYKVGTIRDQHDMRRVGKTQELRVGYSQFALETQRADIMSVAQLPSHISIGLYCSAHVHVGGHTLVRHDVLPI